MPLNEFLFLKNYPHPLPYLFVLFDISILDFLFAYIAILENILKLDYALHEWLHKMDHMYIVQCTLYMSQALRGLFANFEKNYIRFG